MADNNTKACTICLEDIIDTNISYLPCCHGFHQHCFSNYIEDKIKSRKNISCPICRIEHFVYGHRNYEFIMNELGITYDVEKDRNTPYEQYIPSGLHTYNLSRMNNSQHPGTTTPDMYNLSRMNNNAHSTITMPAPVSPNNTMVRTPNRRRQQISCNVFWFKYRYYIIVFVLLIVVSSVAFMFLHH